MQAGDLTIGGSGLPWESGGGGNSSASYVVALAEDTDTEQLREDLRREFDALGEGAAISLYLLPPLAFVAILMLWFARKVEVT